MQAELPKDIEEAIHWIQATTGLLAREDVKSERERYAVLCHEADQALRSAISRAIAGVVETERARARELAEAARAVVKFGEQELRPALLPSFWAAVFHLRDTLTRSVS